MVVKDQPIDNEIIPNTSILLSFNLLFRQSFTTATFSAVYSVKRHVPLMTTYQRLKS